MKKVILYMDGENEILLSKDHYHGVALQVIRYIDSMQQTPDNLLVNIKTAKVIHQKIMKIPENKDMVSFRGDIQKEIAECQAVVNNIKENDQKINGLMNDFFSAHRELNEPAEQ